MGRPRTSTPEKQRGDAKRRAELAQERKAQGLVRLELWLPKGQADDIIRSVEKAKVNPWGDDDDIVTDKIAAVLRGKGKSNA